MMKAKAYTLHPEGVNFVNSRKANKISNDVRLLTSDTLVLMDTDMTVLRHFY